MWDREQESSRTVSGYQSHDIFSLRATSFKAHSPRTRNDTYLRILVSSEASSRSSRSVGPRRLKGDTPRQKWFKMSTASAAGSIYSARGLLACEFFSAPRAMVERFRAACIFFLEKVGGERCPRTTLHARRVSRRARGHDVTPRGLRIAVSCWVKHARPPPKEACAGSNPV